MNDIYLSIYLSSQKNEGSDSETMEVKDNNTSWQLAFTAFTHLSLEDPYPRLLIGRYSTTGMDKEKEAKSTTCIWAMPCIQFAKRLIKVTKYDLARKTQDLELENLG